MESLSSVFFQCISIFNQNEIGSLCLTELELESLLEKFSFCSQEVQSLRLFSTNEDFEEILTQHLPLLLIDAFMAEILIKLKSTDLKDRARLVTRAKTALQSFLDQCELYDLIPPSEFKYSKAMSNPSLPPMERRNLKIHRQKESKERQRALDDLQVQIQTVFASLPVTQTSILPPSIFLRPSNAQLKSPSPLPCLDDEETLSRSFCVQWIQSWISKSIDTMLFLDEELHHLHFALSLSPTTGSPSVPLDDQTQLDVLPSSRASQAQDGPLLDPKGKVLRSFSIVSQRSQLQHQVFQPGHRLPTMTIDEYLEAEKNRGGILDGSGSREQPKSSLNSDSETENETEADRIKKMHWDEFKEDNPRGWGNAGGNRG